MNCRVLYGINSVPKTFLSVQQCLSNSLIKNKKRIPFRGLNTLTDSAKSKYFVTCFRQGMKNRKILNDKWKLEVFSKGKQCVVWGCNSFSGETIRPNVDKCEKKEKRLSVYQRLKIMFKEYRYIVLTVHIITSIGWMGFFYLVLDSGVDIPQLLKTLGAPDSWCEAAKNSPAGHLAVAYTLYKLFTPIRYTVTVGGSSAVINYYKRKGWIKSTPKEGFKKIYEEQKGALQDFKTNCQKKMQVTKDEFLKTKKDVKQQLIDAREEFHRSVKESRDDLKEGVKSATDEWKAIGGLVRKSIKEATKNHTPTKK